jgi:hypothetical protein
VFYNNNTPKWWKVVQNGADLYPFPASGAKWFKRGLKNTAKNLKGGS